MKTSKNNITVLAFLITVFTVDVILSQKLIIDVDVGTDDAIGLSYFLRAEQMNNNSVKIMGITCVAGITKVDNVVMNVLKLLKISNRLDIPVYRGDSRALISTRQSNSSFGVDGMGDVEFPYPPSLSLVQSEHGVDALIRMVNENPGEITLVTTGPLTNVALAVGMDRDFLNKLKKLYILGGTMWGKYNNPPDAEVNFYLDPEANYMVLTGSKFRPHSIAVLPWETLLRVNVSWDWRRDVLGQLNSPEILFLNDVEDNANNTENWIMGGGILASLVIQPNMYKQVLNFGAEAILEGPKRGNLLLDYFNIRNNKTCEKIDLLLYFDTKAYKETLIKYFS